MSIFRFKQFEVKQSGSTMKVGTDAMLLGAVLNTEHSRVAIEVGAGTGVISLMVAQRHPSLKIHAIELDDLSFEECKYNFQNSLWRANLNAHLSDFLKFESEKQFDLIFSNPPYYQTKLENANRREAIAKHESSLPMNLFVEKMEGLLTRAGEIWLIIPYVDAEKWLHSFGALSLYPREKIEISGKRGDDPNRLILRLSRKKMKCIKRHFVVRENDGSYSDEYKELTKDYHANTLR